MKTWKNYTVAIMLSVLLLPCIVLAQRYHVDPNQPASDVARPVSPRKENVDPDKIVIRNNYSSAVTVLISADSKTWDTLQVKEKNYWSHKQKLLYVKVYTSVSNYKLYQLAAGTAYQLYWNKDEQVWQIVK